MGATGFVVVTKGLGATVLTGAAVLITAITLFLYDHLVSWLAGMPVSSASAAANAARLVSIAS